MVDAPASDVTEIVVTIDEVKVHVAGSGWTVLSSETRTVDLLKLQGGSYALLGVASLPPGRLTQMRLHVKEGSSNYVTTPDGVHHPLKTPSGEQSGLKIKLGVDFTNCEGGHVTIDFDGKKSIFVHPKGGGAGDEWILRPVIRLKSVRHKAGSCAEPLPPSQPPVAETPDPAQPETPSSETPGEPPSGEGPACDPSQPLPPTMTPLPPDTSDPCGPTNCPAGNVCIDGVCGVL
jgi:hypothetical protein